MFTLEHVTDEHKKLTQILKDDNVTRLVVEHKDRLTRFGFNYIKTLFHGKIVVVNEVNDQEQDLIQDFVSHYIFLSNNLRKKTDTKKNIRTH